MSLYSGENMPRFRRRACVEDHYYNYLDADHEHNIYQVVQVESPKIFMQVDTDFGTNEIETKVDNSLVIDPTQKQFITDLMDELGPEAIEMLCEQFVSLEGESSDVVNEKIMLRDAFLNPNQTLDIPPVIGDLRYDFKTNTLYENAEAIFNGTAGEALTYIALSSPGKFNKVVSMLQKSNSMQVIHTSGFDYNGILKQYREQRAESASVDKLSKFDQTDYIEQDHLGFRFGTPYTEHETTGVYWLTTDEEKPHAPWAIQQVQGEIDSLTIEEINELGADDILLANVVKGDAQGATANKMNYLKPLWEIAKIKESQIMVEIFMDAGIPEEMRGFVFTKPRKHNLTVVVELNVKGECLKDMFARLFVSVEQANIDRNRRLYDPTYFVKRKQTFRSPVTITNYFIHPVTYTPHQQFRLKKSSETSVNKKQAKRSEVFKEICENPNSGYACRKEEWPYVILKSKHRFGSFHLNDLGYGGAQFVFRSLYEWAEAHGGSFYSKHEGFKFKPKH